MSIFEETVNKQISELDKAVGEFINKTNEEVEKHGKIGEKNKQALAELTEKTTEAQARLLDLEQKSVAPKDTAEVEKSLGQAFSESEALASMRDGKSRSAKFDAQNNTIIGSDTTVAPDRRGGIVGGAFRSLRISDVIPQGSTSSNAVEYTKENAFTNAAAETAENTVKPESSLTFTLVNAPVRTIAHWIKLSKQVMDDAPMLASYIDGRMAYGVMQRLDSQLLNGDGTSPNLSGILDTGNFTAFSPTANDTAVVSIRKAITQVQLADYNPTAIILNPATVQDMDLDIENTNISLTGPRAQSLPSIWGVPIVTSNAVPNNNFAIGAFDMACEFFTREGVSVELFEQDDTNVQSNLVTMRAEMRGALTVYRPASIVGGTLTS